MSVVHNIDIAEVQGGLSFGQAYDQPHWYALYTNSRHEKKVAGILRSQEIGSYVPLYKTVRRWADRRKEVELPLFPGYVFVQIALRSRLKVLTVPGVVHLVSFDGKPAPVNDVEIETLRQGLPMAKGVQPHPYLKVGRRVCVQRGPFAGIEGILVRRKDAFRLVLSIQLIMRSVSVEIDEADVAPAN
jgi:transcription antitermination factor NusG